MATAIDHTGQRFGMLMVLERTENKGRHAAWMVECDCGTVKAVAGHNLRHGQALSCGCVRRGQDLTTAPGYKAVHYRLKARRGPASSYTCVDCETAPGAHWSFDQPTGYSADLSRYQPRCAACHVAHDRGTA
jgi:hypothetical protein